jgi:hypothetical protein
MTDSPPRQVIYSSLPDSPIQVVYGQVASSRDDTAVATPQRKKRRPEEDSDRKLKWRRSSRGRASGSKPQTSKLQGGPANPESSVPPDDSMSILSVNTPDKDELQSNLADSEVGYNWQWEGPKNMPISQEKVVDADYLAFVDAVLTDECLFVQLNCNIFVVNGWNRKKKEARVCTISHLGTSARTDAFLSSCRGSISNEALLRIPVFFVFVRRGRMAPVAFTFGS